MILKGLTASQGIYEGKAKIIKSVEDMEKIEQGDVMVVHTSSPAYATGLFKAGAVVSENGGTLFHLAILAREIGIPCVTGIENATTIIKSGDMVKVCGMEEGEVYVGE